MKSLQEFKVILEEEKKDYSKFDALVRAGLGNKAQIQRLHQILGKMEEDRPSFTNADKQIIQNLFNKMVDLITNNPQVFRQTKKAVSESIHDTSDYKLSKSGKKVKAHRIRFDDEEKEEVKEEMLIGEALSSDPPFVVLLKRTAIRLYPNGMRVAIYHSDRLNRDFAIPFNDGETGIVQSEEYIEEAVMDTLHKIVDTKSAQSVKFASGHTRKIDHFTASAITQVHKALNDENKKKFADMVHKSPAHFEKAAAFAFSKAK
jgi:hypothetical protein